jgi:gliding motility-associated-like protein
MKLISLFFIFFTCSYFVFGATFKVTTTNFTGPGSISEAISNATGGSDTVLCDVKGIINFTSTINLTNNVTIIGPSSDNLLLQSTGQTLFNINVAASNVSITGFTLTTSGVAGGSAIVSGASELVIYDCIFTNCNSSSIGGAIQANTGGLTVHSCSFINVISATNGGSIFLTSSSGLPSNIINCTFGRTSGFSPENAQNGGAIYINSSAGIVNIVNNTFARLAVTNQGGGVYSNSANYDLRNNIFYQNAPNNQFRDLAGTMPSLRGYNCFQQAPTAYVPGVNDINGGSWVTWISGNSALQLQKFGRGQYGLNVNEFAPSIDNADQSAIFTYFDNLWIERKDIRSAPREVQGVYYGNNQLDRGSLEYSPFRVTNNNATGAGSLADIVDSVNNSVRPGALYVWFEIPTAGPHTILATSQYSPSRDNIILDGFSQSSSKEGAKTFGPEYMIDILDNASLTACFYTFGDNVEIIGFKIQNYDIPILIFSNSVGVFGNYIINGNYGITVDASMSFCNIGSQIGKDRNYIVSCNAKAMEIGGSYHSIRGNFIGVEPNGTANGNNEGIDLNGALDCTVGGNSVNEGNLICSSTLYGIRVANSSNSYVFNNVLGVNPTYSSTVGFENNSGIEVENSNFNYIGSFLYPHGGNVIVSSLGQGLILHNAIENTIQGNIIGLFPDGVTNGAIGTNGIRVSGNTSYNNFGDFVYADFRNVIGNCNGSGYYSDATTGTSNNFVFNYIGTDVSGTISKPNGANGVHFVGNLDDDYCQAFIENNIISNHTNATNGYAIYGDNAAISTYNNKIGIDVNGNPMPNRIGINVNGWQGYSNLSDNIIKNSQIQGVFIQNGNGLGLNYNTIENNGAQGVLINNVINIFIDGNIVINNTSGGIIIPSGSDTVVMRNSVLHSNGLGLDFDLGTTGVGGYTMNGGLEFPTLTQATYCGGELSIGGSFNTTNSDFFNGDIVVEYYLLTTAEEHSSGHGGSLSTIGIQYSSIDGTGYADVSTTIYNTFNPGDKIVATVSLVDPFWGEGVILTSEFSGNFEITSGISVTVAPTNPLCTNDLGSATATVVGSSNDPEWHLVAALGNPIAFGLTVSNLMPDNYACIIVNGSCTDTAFFTITAPSPIIPGVAGTLSNVNCFGGADGSISLSTPASGGTAPYQYSIDNVIFQATDVFTSLPVGNYHIYVRDANNCLDSTASLTITQPATPLTVSSSTTNLTCFGSDDGSIIPTISGGVPGYNFSWSGPNSFSSTTQNISALEPGFYVLTVTDINGCQTIENAAEIIEPASNNVNFTISNATACVGEGITFTNTSDPGATAFFWNFGNGNLTNNTLENSSTVYTGDGTYFVDFIVTYGVCQDSLTQVINVNPVPVLTNANTTNICSGENVNFTFTTDIPSTLSWYALDNTNVTGETFTTQTTTLNNDVLVNNSGTPQMVEYIVTPATAQCTSSGQSFYAWVFPLPNVMAPSDTAVCENQPLTFSGNGAVTYTWNNGITDGVSFNPLTTTTYTVTGTDGDGCTNTDNVTVTVNTLPNVIAPADYTICDGQSTTLNGTGALSYTWTNGISDGIAFNPISTQTYTVTGVDANGCENIDDVIITVNSLPNVTAPADYAICDGENTLLNGAGAVSYTWSNGVNNGVSFSPASTQFYVVTGFDAAGCSNTDTVTITVNTLPNVIAPADYTICNGASTSLNGSGASTYLWDNGVTDGVAFNPTSTALYTLTGTDANGCENTDQVIITVTSISITLNVTDVSCFGLNDGAVSYTINSNAPPFQMQINSFASYQMVTNPEVYSTVAAGFSFTGTVTDANGCVATESATVGGPNAINIAVVITNDTCNAGVGAINYSSVSGGVPPYLYADLSGTFSTSTIYNGNAGSYIATVQDANGCTSIQDVTISNVTAPVNGGTFGPYETCDDEPIEIVAFGGDSYSWSGGSTSIPSVANPTVTPTQTTMYYVTIGYGTCSMVDSVLVSIGTSCDSLDNNTVINTNAFSPNGDGVNDVLTFDIPNLLQDNDNKVYFINRWGDVIREYDNYNNVDVAWDGKNKNGIDLPEGTYFYIIEIPSQDYKASGWIQLIRNNSNN